MSWAGIAKPVASLSRSTSSRRRPNPAAPSPHCSAWRVNHSWLRLPVVLRAPTPVPGHSLYPQLGTQVCVTPPSGSAIHSLTIPLPAFRIHHPDYLPPLSLAVCSRPCFSARPPLLLPNLYLPY